MPEKYDGTRHVHVFLANGGTFTASDPPSSISSPSPPYTPFVPSFVGGVPLSFSFFSSVFCFSFIPSCLGGGGSRSCCSTVRRTVRYCRTRRCACFERSIGRAELLTHVVVLCYQGSSIKHVRDSHGCIRTADNHRRRGGTHPWTQISWWERMKFTKGNIDLGYFWYTKFWVPDPLPSPSSLLIHPWGHALNYTVVRISLFKI